MEVQFQNVEFIMLYPIPFNSPSLLSYLCGAHWVILIHIPDIFWQDS
jgi:hypothetical protein